MKCILGSASVARGLSNYVDSLLNNTLNNTFIDIFPIHGVSFLSQYFDPLAFSISVLLAIALAFGMKESSIINNIITLINVAVVIFAVIAGSTKGKFFKLFVTIICVTYLKWIQLWHKVLKLKSTLCV